MKASACIVYRDLDKNIKEAIFTQKNRLYASVAVPELT